MNYICVKNVLLFDIIIYVGSLELYSKIYVIIL